MHRFASLARFGLIAFVTAVAGVSGAEASFISTSPDPFPAGAGFVQSPGCLMSGPLAGLCASDVKGRILSSSSTFSGGNEYFVLDEAVAGVISDNGVAIGSFSVVGDLDVTLFGRTSPGQIGLFDGVATSEDYMGALDGVPIQFTLEPTPTSTASVTITPLPLQSRLLYQIDSTFDLFSQISIEGGAPIPVGGFPIVGVASVPEPPVWIMLSLGFLGLGLFGAHRRVRRVA